MVPVPDVVKPVKGKPKLKPVLRHTLHFGLDAPQRPGDFGLVTENGMAWLVRALPADETVKRKKDEEEEIHLQRLMPADALRIRGRHNASNALAALALATAIGCPLAPMLHGLREYTGEPHRVQFVARIPTGMGEVEAFDDSKGTNVGATVAALDGLGGDKAPSKLVVILGGDGKGQDFSPLGAPLLRHARAVATIGKDAAAIEAVVAEHASGLPLMRFDTLEAAVPWCFQQAHAGDAVLLSPACASLDMFRNYAHRAEVFVSAVERVAANKGLA
jgi:UDP-N-acetylmuramoylalanine--D-glutamate ligase